MKQLIFSIIFVLCGLHSTLDQNVDEAYQPAKPRKIHYSGLVEVMPYIGLQNWGLDYEMKNDVLVGGCILTAHGIQLFDKYFFGMGTGINFKFNKVYVPVYYNFRLDFSKEQARPFMSTSLGWQFGYCKEENYKGVDSFGLWSNVMFGYQFKNGLYVSAGFTLQNAMQGIFLIEKYGTFGIIADAGFKF